MGDQRLMIPSKFLRAYSFFVHVITALSFRPAPLIAEALGKTGINVVTRIMGLIMAAVGVEFIANGLKQLFLVLAGMS